MRGSEIPVNTSVYLENGVKITAVKKAPDVESGVTPGTTAKHEARHAVAARRNGTGVESATIISGSGYLGMTRLAKFDAVAAAAAHAHGDSGTGHDMAIIRASGISENAAISGARSALSGAEKEIHEVASMLQRKGTVSGSEIDIAMANAGREKEKISAVIFIKSPDGKEEKREIETKRDTVMIPGEWITLSSLN